MGNIIINGGELFNKGAEAMTFITISELKKRFPEKKIYLNSFLDLKRSDAEKENFQFEIIDASIFDKNIPQGYDKIRKKLHILFTNPIREKKIKTILNQTDFIVDISGYAIGSSWGYVRTVETVTWARVAHKYKIPIYYLPQSFGPKYTKGIFSELVNIYIKSSLKYATMLFAREKEGYHFLKKELNLSNVMLADDIVLQNKELDLSKIYKQIPSGKEILVEKDSVCIIPNIRNNQFINSEQMLKYYSLIIEYLFDKGKKIYIVRHSEEDEELCREIHELNKNKTQLILQELNCIEFQEFISKFNYVIASRFHAIVHTFKAGVPCIVIGWAVKYLELAEKLGQVKFVVDVRKEISTEKLLKIVEEMENTYLDLGKLIVEKKEEIQAQNCYDFLNSKLNQK